MRKAGHRCADYIDQGSEASVAGLVVVKRGFTSICSNRIEEGCMSSSERSCFPLEEPHGSIGHIRDGSRKVLIDESGDQWMFLSRGNARVAALTGERSCLESVY